MIARFTLLLILAFTALMPARAQMPGANANITATLEAETATTASGDTVTVAIAMKPKPGWHDYWLNPGDAGTPLELEWDLPNGVTAGKIRAPVPKLLWVFGYANYVYERDHAFLVDLKIGPDIKAGTQLPVRLLAEWSECTDRICVPAKAQLSLDLTVGDGETDTAARGKFDRYLAAIPLPLDSEGRYAKRGKYFDLAFPYPAGAAIRDAYFFPKTEKIFDYSGLQKARRDGDIVVISVPARGEASGIIEGLLHIGNEQGVMVRLAPGDVPQGGTPIATLAGDGDAPKEVAAASGSGMNFGVILFSAILGGLLLNLMPCVFPILGLKALSLAKMGGDEGAARRDALAYSAGAILSVVMLGGVMLAVRAGGEQIGWAFQLQEPRIVLALLLLMVAVTLNLLGGFELGSFDAGGKLTRKGGAAGSFWTGILAAVVATPCTGPFMATALGAALLLPAVQAMLLFAGLGLGLALPFLAIAFVPHLRRAMPKPGPWLGTFRKLMAIPMALTAAALLWLLWRLSGYFGLLLGLSSALMLVTLLRIYGRLQRQRGGMALAFAAVAAIISVLTVVILPRAPVAASHDTAPDLLKAEEFSDIRLAEYRAAGHPVFVYFTADWCVTCKINEATALQRRETAAAFSKAGTKVLVGDFTRRDPALARILAQHQRSGVPLYLYYPKDGDVQILPQILTVDSLIKLAG